MANEPKSKEKRMPDGRPIVNGIPVPLLPGEFVDEPVVLNWDPGELEKLLKERQARQPSQPQPPDSSGPKVEHDL